MGVELIPCIQTLAHLSTALKWGYADKIKDNKDVLLIGETETYDFYDGSFYVWCNTREVAIEVSFDTNETEIMITLFDLIQAGLVEKVAD